MSEGERRQLRDSDFHEPEIISIEWDGREYWRHAIAEPIRFEAPLLLDAIVRTCTTRLPGIGHWPCECGRVVWDVQRERTIRDLLYERCAPEIATMSAGYGPVAAGIGAATALAGCFPDDESQKKAKLLLLKYLNEEQAASFKNHGFFYLTGKSGKRYRLQERSKVKVVGAKTELCFGPAGFLPTGDVLLAQKLLLETDEERAWKIANVWENGELRPMNLAPEMSRSALGAMLRTIMAHGLPRPPRP